MRGGGGGEVACQACMRGTHALLYTLIRRHAWDKYIVAPGQGGSRVPLVRVAMRPASSFLFSSPRILRSTLRALFALTQTCDRCSLCSAGGAVPCAMYSTGCHPRHRLGSGPGTSNPRRESIILPGLGAPARPLWGGAPLLVSPCNDPVGGPQHPPASFLRLQAEHEAVWIMHLTLLEGP
jgi:hypothetical protein